MCLIRNSVFYSLMSFSLMVSAQNSISKIEYVETYKVIAISEMHRVGIPASITLAQGILESSYGKSRLATEGNNHFGIKCHKSWNGQVMFYDDDEKDECFRVYENAQNSYQDHSEFLISRERYSFLFELNKRNYKAWAKGLKKAGYATAKDYASRLIELIERYELDQYDSWKPGQLAKLESEENNKQEESIDSNDSSVEIVNVLRHSNNIKYVVAKENETIEILAKRIGIWEWELERYNEIESNYVFSLEEVVFIQPKKRRAKVKTYMVKEGDTLFSISQKFGINQKHIFLRNNLRNELEIRPGVELVLRGKNKL